MWLFTLAVWNELVGVVFIAWPELSQHGGQLVRRSASLLRVKLRPLEVRLRRRLHLRPLTHTVTVGAALSLESGGPARASQMPTIGATDKQLIEFLLGQLKRLDDLVWELRLAVPRQRTELLKKLREVEVQLYDAIEDAKHEIADARIGVRLPGVVLVLLGLVLGYFANVL